MEWNEKERHELRHRWEVLKEPASAIALAMNTSKNSIVAKACRMQLSARPSPISRKPPGELVQRPLERTGLLTLGQQHEPTVETGLFQPCRTCQWPLTTTTASGRVKFVSCDAPTSRGRSYCQEHSSKAFLRQAAPEEEIPKAA